MIKSEENTSIEYLIQLASAGARGVSVQLSDLNWKEILQLASEQCILPLIACAVKDSPSLNCPEPIREYLMDAMHTSASVNMIRRQRIMHLIGEMNAAGIHVRLLKGYAVADCYAYPDCRGSVDTDLLIGAMQEKQACELFEEFGFKVNPREATSQHVICQHAKYGMVELHVRLYAELIEDVWFRGMNEAELLMEAETQRRSADGDYYTLGPTDHLLFLVLHLLKHFISGGLTIKMMMDIALHFQKNKEMIDTERFWKVMRTLDYSTFVSSMLHIMIAYGSFLVSDFPGIEQVDPEKVQLLLDDLVRGGYMGTKEKKERHESGMEYNRRMMLKNKSEGQYRLYMLLWKARTGARYMFPSIRQLHNDYPFTKQKKICIPLVWIYHMIAFPIKKMRKGVLRRDILTANGNRSDVSHKRVEMFKALGML